MTDDKRRGDTAIEEDHPQTIKLEDNARGGSEAARHQPEPPKYETTSDEASPIPADAELDEDAEAVREHARGAGTDRRGDRQRREARRRIWNSAGPRRAR